MLPSKLFQQKNVFVAAVQEFAAFRQTIIPNITVNASVVELLTSAMFSPSPAPAGEPANPVNNAVAAAGVAAVAVVAIAALVMPANAPVAQGQVINCQCV